MSINISIPVYKIHERETSILYEIPSGKPDHEQTRKLGLEDRTRKIQLAQKGPTCAYYALNFIRPRIGKAYIDELKDLRTQEKLYSTDRKQKSKLTEMLMASEYMLNSEFCSTVGQYINLNSKGQKALFIHLYPNQNKSLITELVSKFFEQTKQQTFKEYLAARILSLQKMCIDAGLSTLKEIESKDEYLESEQLIPKMKGFEHKFTYLSNRITLHRMGPYTNGTAWNPTKDVVSLLFWLKAKGPLLIYSKLGPQCYNTKPQPSQITLGNRKIYSWANENDRSQAGKEEGFTHSLLLVGADATTNTIYYIDPIDGSDPKNKDVQRIYSAPYEIFCKYATTVIGEYLDKNDLHNKEFASYGKFVQIIDKSK